MMMMMSNKLVNFRSQRFSNSGIANKGLWTCSDPGNQDNRDKRKINGNVTNHEALVIPIG